MTKKLIKPMKAPSKSCHMLIPGEDLSKLSFPLYASYKYDGVRCTVQNGVVYSNTLKPIPNQHVQHLLGSGDGLEGLDGELIVGEPNAPDVFRKTMSGVMSREGTPNVRFYVFDDICGDSAYETRNEILVEWFKDCRGDMIYEDLEAETVSYLKDVVVLVEQRWVRNVEELLAMETEALELGYEGLMLRDPDAYYKEGPTRCSLKSGELLKLKRFDDSEFEILELVEAKKNLNEATVNELGRTKRSSHKDGKIAKGTLGSIRGRDIHTGCEITVSTGTLTKEQRAEWWGTPANYIGEIGVYKFFPSGSKDKPRHPTFKGLRDNMDITKKK